MPIGAKSHVHRLARAKLAHIKRSALAGHRPGSSSLNRHQPFRRLAKLLRPFGDGLGFAGRFNVPEPHGLGAKDQNRPPN
jgi:hypothetical protein